MERERDGRVEDGERERDGILRLLEVIHVGEDGGPGSMVHLNVASRGDMGRTKKNEH